MVKFKHLKLKDIAIGCVTEDSLSRDYTGKVIRWINRNTSTKIAPISNFLISKGFACSDYDPILPTKDGVPNIDGKDVYLFAIPNVSRNFVTSNDLVMRAMIAAGTIKQFKPKSINLVFTDLPFGRAERKFIDHKAETARGSTIHTLAHLAKSVDIKSIIVGDLHSNNIHGVFEEVYGYDPIHELSFNPLFAHYLVSETPLDLGNRLQNLVLMGADKGAWPAVDDLISILKQTYEKDEVSGLYLNKIRKVPNNPYAVKAEVNYKKTGKISIKNKHVHKRDDMIDTGGTDAAASRSIAETGIEFGKNTEVPASFSNMSTHAWLAGKNLDGSMRRLEAGGAREIVFMNTHPFIEKELDMAIKDRTTVIFTAYCYGAAIICHQIGRNVNDIFKRNGKYDKNRIADFYKSYRSEDNFDYERMQD